MGRVQEQICACYDMCMAELTERLQVLLDPQRRQRLEQESERTGAPVAALVRAAIDLAYPPRHEDEDAAWERLLAAEPMPVEDWDAMKHQIRDELSDPGG